MFNFVRTWSLDQSISEQGVSWLTLCSATLLVYICHSYSSTFMPLN